MKKHILLIIASLFILGCSKKPVKIGVVLPLTGSLSSYGEMCLRGLELATNKINENGGIKGSQIELLIEDNQGGSQTTHTAIENLDKAGVVTVIGPLTTDNVVAVGEYVDNLKLPLIAPTATGVKATEGRKWIWRIAFTDAAQGIVLARFAKSSLKMDSICIILNREDPYSLGLSKSFENEFERLGGKVLLSVTFGANDEVFNTQLEAVKKQKPQGIFIPVFYNQAGLIIKQARDNGIMLPFVGGDGLDSPELMKIIGDRKGAVYFSTHFFANYGLPEVQDFLHQYRLKYQQEPQSFSALGYDAMRLVAQVLGQSGFSREKFNATIGKTSYTGATGKINFLESRDPQRSLMMLKYEQGKPIETVSYFLLEASGKE